MSRCLWAALSGALFGLGLVVSGLANPEKVLAFLDITGIWDPSLVIVMAVGAAVTALAYRLVLKRSAPLSEPRFYLPAATELDRNLVMGAVLFGLGWGLVGYCPGPGLTALVTNPTEGIIFVGSMLAGSLIFSATTGELRKA